MLNISCNSDRWGSLPKMAWKRDMFHFLGTPSGSRMPINRRRPALLRSSARQASVVVCRSSTVRTVTRHKGKWSKNAEESSEGLLRTNEINPCWGKPIPPRPANPITMRPS